MATHSSTLAWKIPWMEKPSRLQSMGSQRVGHNWVTSLSLWIFVYKSLYWHYVLYCFYTNSGILLWFSFAFLWGTFERFHWSPSTSLHMRHQSLSSPNHLGLSPSALGPWPSTLSRPCIGTPSLDSTLGWNLLFKINYVGYIRKAFKIYTCRIKNDYHRILEYPLLSPGKKTLSVP